MFAVLNDSVAASANATPTVTAVVFEVIAVVALLVTVDDSVAAQRRDQSTVHTRVGFAITLLSDLYDTISARRGFDEPAALTHGDVVGIALLADFVARVTAERYDDAARATVGDHCVAVITQFPALYTMVATHGNEHALHAAVRHGGVAIVALFSVLQLAIPTKCGVSAGFGKRTVRGVQGPGRSTCDGCRVRSG